MEAGYPCILRELHFQLAGESEAPIAGSFHPFSAESRLDSYRTHLLHSTTVTVLTFAHAVVWLD